MENNLPVGYCRKYKWRMTPEDVKRKGCLSRKRQKRYRREKCRHFREFSLRVRMEEYIRHCQEG